MDIYRFHVCKYIFGVLDVPPKCITEEDTNRLIHFTIATAMFFERGQKER